MPLEAGSVFVRIAGLFDNNEFKKADRAVAAMRADAKKDIKYKATIDSTGLRVAAKIITAMRADSRKNIAYKATVDKTGLSAAKSAVTALRADARKAISYRATVDDSGLTKTAAVVAAMRADSKKPIVYTTATDGASPNGASSAPLADGGGSGGGRGLLPGGMPAGGRRQPRGAKGFRSPGHVAHELIHTKGGPFGMGGFTLGSMVGLGPEHAIGTGVSFAGSLGPAAAGAGVAALGAVGPALVGGGSDMAVMKNTLQQTTKLYAAYEKLKTAQDQYGKSSTQAKVAQQALNLQMKEFGGGPGTEKELALAKQVDTLKTTWDKAADTVRTQSTGIMSQIVGLAQSYVPNVTKAAKTNLTIIDSAIKPLFKWLEGPQGKGIFTDLEKDFAKNLPTSIHAGTQALEYLLRVIDQAASHGGKFAHTLDNFFTRKNAESTDQIGASVSKLLGDFRLWMNLLKIIGTDTMAIIHSGNGEGNRLVLMLTHLMDKFNAWETSAKGATALKSFFSNRSSEMGQLLKTLGSVIVLFGQFYLSVQPIVPIVTLVFQGINKILTAVKGLSEHSSLFRDMFVVPMGAFLLSWKLFSLKSTIGEVGKLGKAIMILTGIRKADTVAQDVEMGTGAAKGEAGLARKLIGGVAGLMPVVGGKLKKGILGGAEAVAGKGGISGVRDGTGPGSRLNPIVTVSEAGDKTPLGNSSSDAEKAAKDAEKGVVPGAARTAEGDVVKAGEQGVLPGLERAAVPAAEGAIPALALTGAGAAEGATGIAAALGSLGVGGAVAAGIATALPPVAIAAAIGGAIYLGIKAFQTKGAPTYAGTESRGAAAPFTAAGHKQTKATAALQSQIQGLLTDAHTAEGAHTSQTAGPMGGTTQIGPTKAQLAQASADYTKAGQVMESKLQAGWAQYATHDAPTMLRNFQEEFKGSKTKTQAAGAEAMLAYMQGLEKNKELPVGSVKSMLAVLEQEYPKLIPILGKSGKEANVALMDGLDLKKFTTAWDQTFGAVMTGPTSMPDIANAMGQAGKTIQDKWGAALGALPADTHSPLLQVRTIARTNLAGMVADANKFLPLLPQQYATANTKLKSQLLHNMGLAINGIKTLVNEGVISAKAGTKQIQAILVGEMDAVDGAVSAKVTALLVKEKWTAGQVARSVASAGWTGQGAGKGQVVSERGGELPGFAGGGMVPGKEYGYDDKMTLVDPAGRPRARMAGDESIYTRHQRPYVDAGLQAIGFSGGSKDLWSKVDRPHGRAGGGELSGVPGFARGGKQSTSHKQSPIHKYLKGAGLGDLTAIDNQVSQLDTRFNSQDQLFQLANPSGVLPPNDVAIELGIRDQQWDLLYKEWKSLPKALKRVQNMVYGTPHATGTTYGNIGGASMPVHRTGGINKQVASLQGQVKDTTADIAGLQQQISNANANAANARLSVSQAAANAAASSSAGLTGAANSLQQIHAAILSDTQLIAQLTASLKTAGPNTGKVQGQITAAKADRVKLQNQLVAPTAALHAGTKQRAQQAANYRQQNYDIAANLADIKNGLAPKIAKLKATLVTLKAALIAEQKLAAEGAGDITNLKGRLYGASGTESVLQSLGDYGYDILSLLQIGGKETPKRKRQIQEVYKALHEVLPAGLLNGSAAAAAAATATQASVAEFTSSLSASLLGFGSNFVAAGANPFGTQAQKLSGLTNYGAASGPAATQSGRARGGELPPPPPPTPYGGKGDTNINITQHFARGPADAHTYSNGLKWELGAAI